MGVGQSLGLTETVAEHDVLMRLEYLSMPMMLASIGFFLLELFPRDSFRRFVLFWGHRLWWTSGFADLVCRTLVFGEYLFLFQIEIL